MSRDTRKFVLWAWCKIILFPDKARKKHRKQDRTVKTLVRCTERNRNFKMCLFESQILFCKRAETVGVYAINALN